MTLRGTILFATVNSLILAGGIGASLAAPTNAPDFKEVYDLLRTHLPGATDDSLNQAAVAGLLSQLNGRAELISDSTDADTNTPPVQVAVLDQTVAYLRVRHVTENLPVRLGAAVQTLSASNRLAGTVLDLRFATGDAYATIQGSVDLLDGPKTPVIVLVNAATSGAAEVLAAELHEGGALLLGNPTAGLARTTEDFPLTDGEKLRLATTPIKLHGVEMSRLQPDITIKTSLDEERTFMENPYVSAAGAGASTAADTNNFTPLLDHTTEADLVRQKRKDGDGDENPEPPAKTEPARPVLHDPVLARAVDLVEGLAVVRAGHL